MTTGQFQEVAHCGLELKVIGQTCDGSSSHPVNRSTSRGSSERSSARLSPFTRTVSSCHTRFCSMVRRSRDALMGHSSVALDGDHSIKRDLPLVLEVVAPDRVNPIERHEERL